MIISHQNKYIFLRIPKTASTSVAIALSKYCGPSDVVTRVSKVDEELRRSLGYVGPQNFERKIWKYDLSDWRRILFQHKPALSFKHSTAVQVKKYIGNVIWESYLKFCVVRNPFDRAVSLYYWDIRNKDVTVDLNEYILNSNAGRLSTWNRFTINNTPAMDIFCRFENLQNDLDIVSTKIGLPPLELPKTKTNYRKDHTHYSKLINSKARARIEEICALEIKYFDYYWNEA